MDSEVQKQPEIEESHKSDDGFSFNIPQIKKWCTKQRLQTLLVLFLILIPMFFSIYFRVYPASLPITDQWAEQSINRNLINQFANQIRSETPFLPPDTIQREANKRAQEYINSNLKEFTEAQKQASKQFKNHFKNKDGQTYLLAIDPYQYYRLVKNKVEKGHVGDILKEGKPYDTHKLAPIGGFENENFHIKAGYIWHKLISFFNRDVSVMTTFFYIPVLFAALSILPAFFIARKVGGNGGGFISAFLVGIHPAFLNRTPAGFSDTDVYNVFFPLYIFWLFIEGFETNNIKKKCTLIGCAGILTGIYAYAWSGWWYIFWIIAISLLCYMFYYLIFHYKDLFSGNLSQLLHKKEIKNPFTLFLLYSITSSIFVIIFASLNVLKIGITGPFKFALTFKKVATFKIWPNVYTTVAELNAASIPSIVGQIGGKLLFFIALMGLVLSITRNKFDKITIIALTISAIWYAFLLWLMPNSLLFIFLLLVPVLSMLAITIYYQYTHVDIKYAIFLLLWFTATIYASRSGVRFILLLVPAFSIACGVGIGILYQKLVPWLHRNVGVNKFITKSLLIMFVLFLLATPFKSAHQTATHEIPSMNDAWYEALTYIKENSKENAIINSWWDFGHWFKAIGDRAVTFDGGSQNTPMAHWIGKVLLTDNELEAIGILRMLDCGSRYGFQALNKYIDDEPRSVNIIYNIVVLNKEEAKEELEKEGLSSEESLEVLTLTHCNPPEDFFIASEDMVGKSGVWAHFGSWNFEKASMFQKVKKENKQDGINILIEDFNLDPEKAEKTYIEIQTRDPDQWIAPWPSYSMAKWYTCDSIEGDYMKCPFNVQIGNQIILKSVIINLTNVSETYAEVAAPRSDQIQRTFLNGIHIVKKDDFESRYFNESEIQLDIVIAPSSPERFKAILFPPALAKSMFTRMFFLDGHSLQYFDFKKKTQSITGQKIKVFKVDWEGTDKTNIFKDLGQEDKVLTEEEIIKSQFDRENAKVKASHLLISTDNRSDEEALELITEIRNNISKDKVNTKRFAEFAKIYSEGPSAEQGGDLGWFGKGVMVKEFEEAIFNMKVGTMSEPVKTEFGYHLIYLVTVEIPLKE